MKRPLTLVTAAAAAAVLAVGGCSDGSQGGDGAARNARSAATASPTPTSGERSSPAPSPSPTPKKAGVGDLAGGWMPVGINDGVYTLLIDKNGGANSVGSPGPYSAAAGDKLCFGSIRGEGEFTVKLDCRDDAALKGPGRPYRGTAVVDPSYWDRIMDCDEGPGALIITWDDGDQETLCRLGDS